MSTTKISDPVADEQILFVHPPIAPVVENAAWRRRLRAYTGRTLSDTALTAEQDYRAGHLVTLAQAWSAGILQGLEVTVEWPGAATTLPSIRVSPGRGLTASGEDVLVSTPLRVALSDLLGEVDRTTLRAAVLIAEPVELLTAGNFQPEDPCEVDESAFAFSDEQRVDGTLLTLLPWQDEWSGGPLNAATATRNALAYAIFERERNHLSGEHHPWESAGVPLALLGFEGGSLQFVDRFAVAREGGHPRQRTAVVAAAGQFAGTRPLWTARVQQLAAHLQDLALDRVPVTDWASQLRLLPPVGLLPLSALDLMARRNEFFPPNFALRMAPIPLEQLEWTLDRSASLAPLDTSRPERVLVLVPVPQAHYEPNLLVEEGDAPEFSSAVTSLQGLREQARAARQFVRECHTALVETLHTGLVRVVGGTPQPNTKAPVTPRYDDAGALEAEPPVTASQGTEESYGVVADQTPTPATAIRRPNAWLQLRARVRTLPFLTADERASFERSGLSAFIEELKSKISRADDALDFSFLKAHTDIYRARQLMLGTAVASRLLTSPVFATLVQSETAVAQRSDVDRFYAGLKGKQSLSGIDVTPRVAVAQPEPAETSPLAFASEPVAFTSQPFTLGALGLTLTREAATTEVAAASSMEARIESRLLRSDMTDSMLRVSNDNLESALVEKARIERQYPEPVVGGQAYDFRTTSIAKRLDSPPAEEARSYASVNRFEAIQSLDRVASAGLNLDGVQVFGVQVGTFDTEGFPVRQTRTFEQVRASGIQTLLQEKPPQNPLDDGVHMLESIRILEHNIATLRSVEVRIASYQSLLSDCRSVLDVLTQDLARAASRLTTLDGQVEDLRHRVGTAVALLADERARVATTNQRRASVLAQQVRLLAYLRPRSLEAIVESPAVNLDPSVVQAAVPACLDAHDDAPPELETMVRLMRETPLSYFRYLPQALDKLDRVELLHGTVAAAQLRAKTLVNQPKGAVGGLSTFSTLRAGGQFGASIARLLDAQQARVTERRMAVVNFDLSKLLGLGWRASRDHAVETLTVGDLIEANHGRSVAARTAEGELDHIRRVGACLHSSFGDVLPAIRLAWAERLGQHDEGVALGNLAALPRFSELPFVLRKELQALTDWLYDRFNPKHAEAVRLVHEYVRVCILLASHAPVDEIVTGQVALDSQAAPGGTLQVTIDPIRVKVGMRALFYRGQDLVAHGIVDDLTGSQARTRVVDTADGRPTNVPRDTTVRFVTAARAALPTSFLRVR